MNNENEQLDRAIARLERHGVSRRSALKVILMTGLGAAASPLISKLAWGAEGLQGFPLARPDKPVTLPMIGEPITDGMKPESGIFTVFNYSDYLYKKLLDKFGERYNVDVRLSTFANMDQAITKLANHDIDADVTEITPDRLAQATIGKLLQPINHSYIPNLQKNVWPQLHDPFYDQGARYTVPYTCYTTGIGWRSDKISEDIAAMDNPWSIFWKADDYKGFTGVINSPRETLGLAMLYRGNTQINTQDPEAIGRALADLQKLSQICNPKVDQTAYRSLPQGTSWLHQAWSGGLLGGAMFYLPEGGSADNLQYWVAPKGHVPIQNDCWAVPAATRKPVLAHLWMNFMLEEENAYSNFINYTGYQPPINSISSERLTAEGAIPKHLHTAIMSPADFGAGSIQYMTLTPKGQRIWQDAYARFISGV